MDIVYVLEKRLAWVVAFVAVTVMVPEVVNTFDGESTYKEPVVLTLTPVKFSLSLMVHVIGVTATWRSVVCDVDPLVPVTVTLYNPTGVVWIVDTVKMLLQEQPAVTASLLGLVERVSPDGVLDAERFTVPEKPFRLFRTIRVVVELPAATERSSAVEEIEKSPVLVRGEMRCPGGACRFLS